MKRQCRQTKGKRKGRGIAGVLAFFYATLSIGSFLSGCGIRAKEVEKKTKEDTGAEAKEQAGNDVSEQSETEMREELEENPIMMAKELEKSYGSKSIRALESVRTQMGEEAYLEEIARLGSAEKVSNHGDYIASIIEDVTDKAGEEKATEVMRACGYQCIKSGITQGAREAYQNADSTEEFIDILNTKVLGGGNLKYDGQKIMASYDYCYCDIADPQKKLNKCYCQCSCGWYEKLFTEATGHTVEVDLIQSIKGGDDHCEFEIRLGEE